MTDILYYDEIVGGNGGTIVVPTQTVAPEDTAAYWVEIKNEGLGVWMQIGYCLGICPPSGGPASFSSQLQLYIEWTDANHNYGYKPLGLASWSSQHHFRVWQYYSSAGCVVAFSIDGTQEPYSPLFGNTCGINAVAYSTLEDHYLTIAPGPDNLSGYWSSLEYLKCGTWQSWGSPSCVIPVFNYLGGWGSGPSVIRVESTDSTGFLAYTSSGPIGGSGCGGCHLV